ncbi:IclR family transcriptional regulator [Kitasatospora sp. NBC_01246]|uniref:IclR family transcriptional regulator n=1 Tax=Kitasatospora sp. NBC_01246 TaxID=2903570 RepID=UPI002E36D45F|nr:IclR family transcriptional regulator [Kitasatospora sp. NBC_01246]
MTETGTGSQARPQTGSEPGPRPAPAAGAVDGSDSGEPAKDGAEPAKAAAKKAAGSERNQSSSLRRALAVLGHVRDHGNGRGVPLAQLAEALGLNKSTVLRLAGPLLDEHLLDRDRETGWFRLGHGSLRLGQAYLSTLDLRSVAAEHLRRLQREAGETVHLTVWQAPGIVYLDKVEDETNVRMASRVGSRAPAYCTATGKAILAWLPDEAVTEVVAAGLRPVTAWTISDETHLRADLARIRARGYSIDDRENEPEVRCVAAPIFDHTGEVTAALSVSGLTSRMTAARVRSLGPVVAQVGLRISRELGSDRQPG